MVKEIPKANFAIIGGSSTFSINFPEDLKNSEVKVEQRDLVFETPYGQSPPFKLFSIRNKKVLTCKMHGWRKNVSREDASKQIFWVFWQAGVKKILAEGGVGSINPLLNPRDIIIPNDFIDFTTRKDLKIVGEHLLIMRQAICPQIHQALSMTAQNHHQRKVFERSIYVATEGYRFESPAEIGMMRQWNADIVGQTLCPEVYLARDIGACYAGVYLVVNYAEGVVENWSHDELKNIFFEESKKIGQILLDALTSITDSQKECGCLEFRKPTLLKE